MTWKRTPFSLKYYPFQQDWSRFAHLIPSLWAISIPIIGPPPRQSSLGYLYSYNRDLRQEMNLNNTYAQLIITKNLKKKKKWKQNGKQKYRRLRWVRQTSNQATEAASSIELGSNPAEDQLQRFFMVFCSNYANYAFGVQNDSDAC